MDEPPDEQQLAEGLRRGRREAWQALYDAYARALWRRVARSIGGVGGGDAAAVGDVVQATLMSAATSAADFDPRRGRVWPWLCGIARNQLALHFRLRGKVAVFGDGEATGDAGRNEPDRGGAWACWLAGEADEPPARLAAQELAELVRATLRRLPPDYEELLLARYVDGVPAEMLARRSGRTGQAIRSKLARARRAFEEQLERLAPSVAADVR